MVTIIGDYQLLSFLLLINKYTLYHHSVFVFQLLSLVSTCEVFAVVSEGGLTNDPTGGTGGTGGAESEGGLLAHLKGKSDLSYAAAGIDEETGDVVLSEIEKFRQRQAVCDSDSDNDQPCLTH